MNKSHIKEAFKGIDRTTLAEMFDTNRNYVDQIASGHTIVSAKRAKEIEAKTFGKIKASVLRPDLFD